MNRQLAFNKAWNGIKAQGFVRSIRDNPGTGYSENPVICAYRGDAGCKCFVGHNIPDDKYTVQIEGQQVKTSSVIAALDPELGEVSSGSMVLYPYENDTDFLRWGQLAHDNGITPEEMESNLRKFADDYGLVVPA